MGLRKLFLPSSRRGLVVAVALGSISLLACACATREWSRAPRATQVETAPPPPKPVPSGVASAPPFLSPSADAICGDNWRWDGVRCREFEVAATDDGALPGGGAGNAAAKKPSRDGASGRVLNPKLLMSDIRPGTGKEAQRGDNVRVHYVGTLPDGTEFDSSRRRDTPLEFQLGTGAVIKGFDTAITGMKEGGLRRVTIPPELGYGRQGSPPKIPPSATLVFEIELVEVIRL